MTLPTEIVAMIKTNYGFDLRKHHKSVGFEVTLGEERNITENGADPFEITIVTKIKIPSSFKIQMKGG